MEIALGVVLGVLGVAVAGLVALLVRRRPERARPAPSTGSTFDDLPGFLDSPPGTAGPAPVAPATAWPTLATPSVPTPVGTAPRAAGPDRRVVLGALAAIALLLLAAAAAVALTGEDRPRHGDASRSTAPALPPPDEPGALAAQSVPVGDDGVEARLAFGGVVLDQHAVGVTVGYPALRLTSDGDRALAHLELPTFHCLTDHAPVDPVAAGCTRAAAQYAESASPDLRLSAGGDRLRLAGEFRSYLRPTGGAPEWSGRSYRIDLTVEAVDEPGPDGWRPVAGSLELGAGSTATTAAPGLNVLRLGG